MARWTTPGMEVAITINAAFVAIDGVESVSGPSGQKTEIDGTALGDTASVFGAGIPDFGESTLTCFDNPTDTGNARLLTSFNTTPAPTELFRYRKAFSGAGNTITFNATVKGWVFSAEKNSYGKFTATLRHTGPITLT